MKIEYTERGMIETIAILRQLVTQNFKEQREIRQRETCREEQLLLPNLNYECKESCTSSAPGSAVGLLRFKVLDTGGKIECSKQKKKRQAVNNRFGSFSFIFSFFFLIGLHLKPFYPTVNRILLFLWELVSSCCRALRSRTLWRLKFSFGCRYRINYCVS